MSRLTSPAVTIFTVLNMESGKTVYLIQVRPATVGFTFTMFNTKVFGSYQT